jgi:hypothetical protein
MKKALILLFAVLLLLGCIEEATNCGYDKECLKKAYRECKKAYGIWLGENTQVYVGIIGEVEQRC